MHAYVNISDNTFHKNNKTNFMTLIKRNYLDLPVEDP